MLKKNHDFRQRAQQLLSENTLEENNLPAAVRELLEELADTKESEIDFREIVDNIEENIFITDGSGYVLYVNPAYSRNTGVSASDVLHRCTGYCTGRCFCGGSRAACTSNEAKSLPDVYHIPVKSPSGWLHSWCSDF